MKATLIPIESKKEFKPFKIELEVESIEDAILLFHTSNFTNLKKLFLEHSNDYFSNEHVNGKVYHKEFSDQITGCLYSLLKKEIEEQGFTVYKEKQTEDLKYQNAISFYHKSKAKYIKVPEYHTEEDHLAIFKWDSITAKNVFDSLERFIIRYKECNFTVKTCAFCIKNSEKFEGYHISCKECEYKENHGACGDDSSFFSRKIKRKFTVSSDVLEGFLKEARQKFNIKD